MLTKNFFNEFKESKAYFRGMGNFGEISGEIIVEDDFLSAYGNGCKMTCSYTCDDYGVFSRKDTFINTSNKEITVNSLKSRFVFDGGEYEVYTQFNNWQSESMGGWQPLVTSVVAASASARSAQNATPMLVLWSKQQNRGVVFHLLPNSAWEMKVSRIGVWGKYTKILVELGIQDYNLELELAAGEKVSLPEIICYETQNRLDFDCYKLHNYMHVNYPRKTLAFIYDTWLYRFTDFTVEQLMEQATLAAEMGLEYFVIDAGWFGKGGTWSTHVGDWVENKTGGLCGRMKELSKYVRSLGMKFGIWLEPERAGKDSDIAQERGNEFFQEGENYFLDFSNKNAYERILNTVCDLIDEYNVEFIKFDYNANMFYDTQRTSFLTYFKYHSKFINALKAKYPDIYLCGCAGGGEKTELANYIEHDSFWPSDNESPYNEMRMFKETILRLPPQGFEKWTCIHSLEKYDDHYQPFHAEYGRDERIIACGDATWSDLYGVRRTYLQAYHTASPIGFSCDLSDISADLRAHFKAEISRIKEEREFWKKVVVRILSDTPTVTVYQYSDMSLKKNYIQVVTLQTLQNTITIYPVVTADKTYLINGEEKKTGKEILSEGIRCAIIKWHDMVQILIEEA